MDHHFSLFTSLHFTFHFHFTSLSQLTFVESYLVPSLSTINFSRVVPRTSLSMINFCRVVPRTSLSTINFSRVLHRTSLWTINSSPPFLPITAQSRRRSNRSSLPFHSDPTKTTHDPDRRLTKQLSWDIVRYWSGGVRYLSGEGHVGKNTQADDSSAPFGTFLLPYSILDVR